MPKKEKDPVKQRAGQRGAQIRWQRMLEWHRRLEGLRNGLVRDHWRIKILHLIVRYGLLWHAHGCPASPKSGRKKARPLPEEAERELARVFRRLTPAAYRLRHQLVWARWTDWSGPPLFMRWSYSGLKFYLRVTPEENAKLEAIIRKTRPKPSPQAYRLAEVITARDWLKNRGQRVTIHGVRKLVNERGVSACYETIRKDLQKLPQP